MYNDTFLIKYSDSS